MTPLTIDHVLITRFNVPTPGLEGFIRAQDGWLKDRVELFERFCSPSVHAQSLQNFHWLVYFDPESPPWFMDWLEAQRATRRFVPIFRNSVSREQLVLDLQTITGGNGEILVTTNLDNDDGLAINFIRRVQQSITSSRRTAVYLTHGLITKEHSTYLRSDRRNAFCSVAETWDRPVTAWADWHNRLELTMPVAELPGEPAWLQVIHGRNVSNTVHGQLCSPSKFVELFPYALTGIPNPKKQDVLVENCLLGPVRMIRAGLRAGIKRILLGSLGKKRFDALKNHTATAGTYSRALISRASNSKSSVLAKESGK